MSKEAINEAKKIMEARESLRETTEKISHLSDKTSLLLTELSAQTSKANEYKNMDYLLLDEETQLFLGTLVNNTLSLAALLNQVVD